MKISSVLMCIMLYLKTNITFKYAGSVLNIYSLYLWALDILIDSAQVYILKLINLSVNEEAWILKEIFSLCFFFFKLFLDKKMIAIIA